MSRLYTVLMGAVLLSATAAHADATAARRAYQALRTLGVPTQLVVNRGEHHGFTRPSFLQDRAERMVAWYDRYLK